MLPTFLLPGWLFSINKPWPLALGLPCRGTSGHFRFMPRLLLPPQCEEGVSPSGSLRLHHCDEVCESAAAPVRFAHSWDSRGGSRSTWRRELWFLHRRCLRLSELPPDRLQEESRVRPTTCTETQRKFMTVNTAPSVEAPQGSSRRSLRALAGGTAGGRRVTSEARGRVRASASCPAPAPCRTPGPAGRPAWPAGEAAACHLPGCRSREPEGCLLSPHSQAPPPGVSSSAAQWQPGR